jgi:hypothetical protein
MASGTLSAGRGKTMNQTQLGNGVTARMTTRDDEGMLVLYDGEVFFELIGKEIVKLKDFLLENTESFMPGAAFEFDADRMMFKELTPEEWAEVTGEEDGSDATD